jgi:hypothetical protein
MNSKIKPNSSYGHMHIQAISEFISRFKGITGQQWMLPIVTYILKRHHFKGQTVDIHPHLGAFLSNMDHF